MEQELKITRIFDSPRGVVWKAWTDPEIVKKWWGPEGFTAPHIDIDLNIGGRFLYCMHGPGMDGTVRDFWNVGEFVQIMPKEKIVSTVSFSDKNGNVVPASEYGMLGDWPEITKSTVIFEDVDEGKTKLTVIEDGIPEEMMEPARMGWDQSLDKMAAALKEFS